MRFTTKVCPTCKLELPISSFGKSKNEPDGLSFYCLLCRRNRSRKQYYGGQRDRKTKRYNATKELYIGKFGGKCTRCGYFEFPGSLDFHHIDPKEKDFTPTQLFFKSIKAIDKEIDKCALLCSNCHRGYHNDEWGGRWVKKDLGYSIGEQWVIDHQGYDYRPPQEKPIQLSLLDRGQFSGVRL